MFAVKAQITECLDDSNYPAIVACQFIDSHGRIQIFRDKDVIFCSEPLDESSAYPFDGIVGCEIIGRILDGEKQLVEVSTKSPWGIISTHGETVFEVRQEQIVEIEDSN